MCKKCYVVTYMPFIRCMGVIWFVFMFSNFYHFRIRLTQWNMCCISEPNIIINIKLFENWTSPYLVVVIRKACLLICYSILRPTELCCVHYWVWKYIHWQPKVNDGLCPSWWTSKRSTIEISTTILGRVQYTCVDFKFQSLTLGLN